MEKDFIRVKRGQIYWFDEELTNAKYAAIAAGQPIPTSLPPRPTTFKGNVEGKRRPFLIVSNDSSNTMSNIVNIVPITTRDYVSLPSQVLFFNGTTGQVVLTEQIKTVNTVDLGAYIGSLSDKIMLKVEDAMVVQYGVRNPYSELDSLSQISATIERIIREKAQAVQNKVNIEDTVIHLGKMLEDLFPATEPVKETPKEIPKPIQEIEIVKPDPIEEPIEEITEQPTEKPTATEAAPETLKQKKTYMKGEKFTLEEAKQFLEDYKKYNTDELMLLYDLPDKKTVYAKRYTSMKRIKDVEVPPKKIIIKDHKPYAAKITFTYEECLQFLEDAKNLTDDELMVKYKLPDKKSVWNRKYVCNKRLKNHNEKDSDNDERDGDTDSNPTGGNKE